MKSLLFYLLFGFVCSTDNIRKDVKVAFFEMIDFFENKNVIALLGELAKKDVERSLYTIWALGQVSDRLKHLNLVELRSRAKYLLQYGVQNPSDKVHSLLNENEFTYDKFKKVFSYMIEYNIPESGVVSYLEKVLSIPIEEFSSTSFDIFSEVQEMIKSLQQENTLLKIAHGDRKFILSKRNMEKIQLMSDICYPMHILHATFFKPETITSLKIFEFLKDPAVVAELINAKICKIYKNGNLMSITEENDSLSKAYKILEFLNSNESFKVHYYMNLLLKTVQETRYSIVELLKMQTANSEVSN